MAKETVSEYFEKFAKPSSKQDKKILADDIKSGFSALGVLKKKGDEK